MTDRPAFQARYRVDIPDDHTIVLSSEREPLVFEGAHLGKLGRLIDGKRSQATIASLVRQHLDAASVEYVLSLLREQGHLVSATDATPPWTTLPEILHRLLPLPRRPARGPSLGYRVELCTDYLEQRLATANRRALRSGNPWIIAKPSSELMWIGPLFTPADRRSPCWECLADRLRGHRPVDAWLARRDGRWPDPSSALVSRELRRLLREHLLRHLEGTSRTPLRHRLLAVDLAADTWSWHDVPKRASCTACGNGRPGARVIVDSITGVVRDVRRADAARWPSVHLAMAPVATRVVRDTFAATWRREVQPPSGKGFAPRDAAASALGEALERYCGEFDGSEASLTSTLRRLGGAAVDPTACMLYSEAQYARGARPAADDGRHATPLPFDAARRMSWSAVWSLTHRAWRYLPTASLYYGHPDARQHGMCRADSNGCASGETPTNALQRALLELIERDAVAIWWYNRIVRPSIPLSVLTGTRAAGLMRDCHANGRDVWLLNLENDLGVPVCGAISARRRGGDRIAFGFAADVDQRRAAVRAMAELGQVLAASDDAEIDDAHRDWLESATLRTDPYLRPAPLGTRLTPRRPRKSGDPVSLRRRLEAAGLEVLCLDQTRPDIGVPVMRAIVPGLRHFWPRFATGRLYDVPVRLGWLRSPVSERDLNPVPFFL